MSYFYLSAEAPVVEESAHSKKPEKSVQSTERSVTTSEQAIPTKVLVAVEQEPMTLPAEPISSITQATAIEPWEVAKTTPTDPEFYRIVELMRRDPNFLAGVMQEFQNETDPKRLKWLAFMLGDLRDKPELTDLAGQMLFSGDAQSRTSALALLSRLQKDDPAARDLVLQSLVASQEPSSLIASMNALGRANPEASYIQKQQILQQVSPLTQHAEASVRRRSYDLLFRWSSDEPYISGQLVLGLSDPDALVRRSTAIGFIDYPQTDPSVKLALMDMLNDIEELERNRKLAARALRKIGLNPDEASHVRAVLTAIN